MISDNLRKVVTKYPNIFKRENKTNWKLPEELIDKTCG